MRKILSSPLFALDGQHIQRRMYEDIYRVIHRVRVRFSGVGCALAYAQPGGMSFFVTSAGPGKGADLGGIEGADRHCQSLAQAAGAGAKTWRAYLSTQGAECSECA
jgi:hypothetical protein